METKKIIIQASVDSDTFAALQNEANSETRKVGPHVSHILKQHVAKKEKPFTPKKEYK